MKKQVFPSAYKSITFAVWAALLSILPFSLTAHAQKSNCSIGQNGGVYTALCPETNDSGYFYNFVNGGWQRVAYYKGASTNLVYTYLSAYQVWFATNRATGEQYINTSTGWMTVHEFQALVSLSELARVANTAPNSVNSGGISGVNTGGMNTNSLPYINGTSAVMTTFFNTQRSFQPYLIP